MYVEITQAILSCLLSKFIYVEGLQKYQKLGKKANFEKSSSRNYLILSREF